MSLVDAMSFTRNRLPPSAIVALVIAVTPLATLGAIKARLLQFVSPSAQAVAPVAAPIAAPAATQDPAPKLAATTVTPERP